MTCRTALAPLWQELSRFDRWRRALGRGADAGDRVAGRTTPPVCRPGLGSPMGGLVLWLALHWAVHASDPAGDTRPSPPADAPTQLSATLLAQRDALILNANSAYQAGQYDEATRDLEQLLVLYQQVYPEPMYPNGHMRIVEAYFSLCDVGCARKDYAQVVKAGEAAIRMCRTLHPARDDLETVLREAQLHNYVGVARRALGDLPQAREQHEHAVEACRVALPDDSGGHIHATLAKSYDALASLSLQEGDWHAANQYWSCALEEFQHRLTLVYDIRDQRELAKYLASKATAMRLLGKHQEAHTLAQRSYEINLRAFLVSRDPKDDARAVQSLIDVGTLLRDMGNAKDACRVLDQVRTRLERCPEQDADHPDRLDTVFANLMLLSIARRSREELEIYRDVLWRRYGEAHGTLSKNRSTIQTVELLRKVGFAFRETGDFASAERCYQEALDLVAATLPSAGCFSLSYELVTVRHDRALLYTRMGRYDDAYAEYAGALGLARTLFGTDRYPHGHVLLSGAMLNMATHCWLVGETDAAADLCHQVLVMNESLFPSSEYPNGHPGLYQALLAWSDVMTWEQRFEEAESYARKSHEIIARQALEQADPDSYPRLHDDLANSYLVLGRLSRARGDFQTARQQFDQALSSYEARCSKDDYEGQLSVALALAELGRTCAAEGDFPAALDYQRRSLALRRGLFPTALFPEGHPVLVNALRELGVTCLDAGESAEAFRVLAESVHMEHAIGGSFFGGSSEAQLLNLAARKLQSLGPLVQASIQARVPAEQVYPHAWMRHGFVLQLIADRQRALRDLARDTAPDAYEKYVAMRQDLARILLVSLTDNAEHNAAQIARIRQLNTAKDEMERDLTRDLESTRLSRHAARDVQRLVRLLPERTVFVDFLALASRPYDATMPTRADYRAADQMIAFVVSRDRPIALVDVGDPRQIAALVAAWNDELSANANAQAGEALRRRIWDPVERHFPNDVDTVYIAPDGAVAQVAWSALPCPADTGVLLEQFAIATVPHGRFLLEQLEGSRDRPVTLAPVLAVGDVDYGDPQTASSSAANGVARWKWQRLAGSRRELDAIASCGQDCQLTVLAGAEATTDNVLQALPGARMAHLATHGFYLDDQTGDRLALAGLDYGSAHLTLNQTRSSVLSRSPLLRSGLVLAGANQQTPGDELGVPPAAPPILTAESIIAFDASRLHLVVLSACDTTCGDTAIGDGVLGMQTAFHVAGARNVIAGLWKVPDEATATLMTEFYHRLWTQRRTPLAALRESQLSMLYRIRPPAAGIRGVNLTHTVPLSTRPTPQPESSPLKVHDWAGFVLSGPGF